MKLYVETRWPINGGFYYSLHMCLENVEQIGIGNRVGVQKDEMLAKQPFCVQISQGITQTMASIRPDDLYRHLN